MRYGDSSECFAKFTLGEDKKFAESVFRKLKGSRHVSEKDVLHLEFYELSNGLPLSMDVIACTLADFGENSKIIIRELFKSKLLSLNS
jgi:hypothetical protein